MRHFYFAYIIETRKRTIYISNIKIIQENGIILQRFWEKVLEIYINQYIRNHAQCFSFVVFKKQLFVLCKSNFLALRKIFIQLIAWPALLTL